MACTAASKCCTPPHPQSDLWNEMVIIPRRQHLPKKKLQGMSTTTMPPRRADHSLNFVAKPWEARLARGDD